MSAPSPPPPAGLLRGCVAARAFVFDPKLLGEAEARRRVLEWWRPGARVVDLDGAWLLLLPDEVLVRTARAPGLPFVRSQGRLLAVDIRAEGLDAPPDALVRLEAGRLRSDSLTRFPPVDVSSWLDPGAVERVDLEPLARPPAPPRVGEPAAPPLDVRQRLGVAPASAEAADLRRVLLGGRRASARARRPSLRELLSRVRSWLSRGGGTAARAPGLLARLLHALREAFSAGERPPARPAAGSPPAPSGPSLWARWRGWVAKRILDTRLAEVIGRQHAKYLRRMLDLFESGDVEDALRHAIPLDNEVQAGLTSLALPRPRTTLAIEARGGRATSAWGLDTDLFAHLRRTYRSMFERLEAQGRLEEAAFVLAELLREDLEAVAFLERHGRLRLAAELAEGRNLPVGVQVRQWFLAGDRERALALALRHGAFADAAFHLDKRGPAEQARAWRLLWADALADGGDMLGAAEAVAGIREARHLAIAWLDGAIAQGGPTGARALVRKLGLRPDCFAEIRDRAVALLSDPLVDGLSARVAFAQAVSVGQRSPQLSVLARVAARALVRDAALHGSGRIPTQQVERMIAVADDGPLRADLPSLAGLQRTTLLDRREPLALDWPANDVGRAVPTDAAFLPDGRLVVALGEIGVRLLHRDGRVLAHFDQPAHRLVVSDVGDRVIAVADRGRAKRLARIDLVHRRAASWCDALLGCHAPDYDGRRWFVGIDVDLYLIDAAAERFDALWRVPDLNVHALRRTAKWLHLLGYARGQSVGVERFSYDLPSLVLRARTPLPVLEGEVTGGAYLSESGDCVVMAGGRSDMPSFHTRLMPFPGDGHALLASLTDREGSFIERMARDWFVVAQRTSGALVLELLGRPQNLPKLRLTLGGARSASVHLGGSTLTVADDRGRVIAIDLVHGIVLRDLRIG